MAPLTQRKKGVEVLTFKWISNRVLRTAHSSPGIEALAFKWISNWDNLWDNLRIGVEALNFKMKSILSHRLDRACAERLAGLADIEFDYISR